jgi:hypothetical protein
MIIVFCKLVKIINEMASFNSGILKEISRLILGYERPFRIISPEEQIVYYPVLMKVSEFVKATKPVLRL